MVSDLMIAADTAIHCSRRSDDLPSTSSTSSTSSISSPFLNAGTTATRSSLAVLHLRRDHLLPTFLKEQQSGVTGYKEGSVTNTRFGSYPHSTLIDVPWGTQVLASKVDTGSRGRSDPSAGQKRSLQVAEGTVVDGGAHKKQKLRPGADGEEDTNTDGKPKSQRKQAVKATTGFCHVLPPTPEAWTSSLPHRTQVVYTPDYSFILQKLRVRPGSSVIEAGAGSGSFTHAAARAAFNGYGGLELDASGIAFQSKRGRICSFEYHEPRVKELQSEIDQHVLSSFVKITHRDVYENGFMVSGAAGDNSRAHLSPLAAHVFLDLPAPWRALPHLTRRPDGPLDPTQTVHICIFLPCIEQAQRAITSLRAHGWVEINMQELNHKRIEVRREQVGLELQGLRGVNATPFDLEEAVDRLKEVEKSSRRNQNNMIERSKNSNTEPKEPANGDDPQQSKKADRLAQNAEVAASRKFYKEGRLVHRTEPEIRTHTSYLIFAVLPVEWSQADEARCAELRPTDSATARSEKP